MGVSCHISHINIYLNKVETMLKSDIIIVVDKQQTSVAIAFATYTQTNKKIGKIENCGKNDGLPQMKSSI